MELLAFQKALPSTQSLKLLKRYRLSTANVQLGTLCPPQQHGTVPPLEQAARGWQRKGWLQEMELSGAGGETWRPREEGIVRDSPGQPGVWGTDWLEEHGQSFGTPPVHPMMPAREPHPQHARWDPSSV